jgi:3-deoxy-D-manno-octulosonate 8-phosphate phosphatase (KDO 8-P phosphatase)
MKSELLNKFSSIQIFLFDLEGVLIPKNFVESKENEQALFEKLSNGCEQFKKLGAKFGIVTSRSDALVSKIKSNGNCILLSASLNKVKMVDLLLNEKKLDYKNVFYIGDDLLDIPLLQKSGLSSVPRDGRREVKRVATFTAKSNSGEVLQEIIDYFKESKKMN